MQVFGNFCKMTKSVMIGLLAMFLAASVSWGQMWSAGTNVTATLADGVLTISGTGAMANYAWNSPAPWVSYANVITSVVIEEGVTSIGDGAFMGCFSLTSVTIPNSVTSIGNNAFSGCTRLTEVTSLNPMPIANLPDNVFVADWRSGVSRAGEMTLNVPYASVSAYSDAPVWKDFQKIFGLFDIAALTVGGHAENGKQSDAQIAVAKDYITVKSASWSPEEETFRGGIVYTVTVTLEINDPAEYKFADNVEATVNGHTNVNITAKSATEITLTHAFPVIEPSVSIRQNETRDTRYGIFLENAIVSNAAKISVITPEPAQITLKILDNLGNIVHTVETQCLRLESATPCEIVWNLSNNAGRFVANGTYLVIAEARSANGRIYRYSAQIGVSR